MISQALPPSGPLDFDDNMYDALTLTLYKEEIEQNICSIREEQSALPL